MTGVRIVAATGAELPDAQSLVFEYLASTQREAGRTVPAGIDHLPRILRSECVDLAAAYPPPGALLLAYRQGEPIGCVGLKPVPPLDSIEVKRLYVRPAHRRGGVARSLMHHAHRHAAAHGFARLVLDVMPTRTPVIDFYRQLGYATTDGPDSMIHMQRPADP